jgi:membrane protein YdbS with pleckstrin-like domain
MITNKGITKFNPKAGLILSAVLLFSAIVCLTINYSIDQLMSWSLFPTGALIVLWATIVPMLIMKKNKSLILF